jgi:chlorite dismutase
VSSNGHRQFVKYTFYKLDPAWRRLPSERRAQDKAEFAAVVSEIASGMTTRTYSTVGMRGDADLLLWQATDTLEQVQDSATRVLSTALGGYLDTPHSFLAMTRISHYVDDHRHEGQEGRTIEVKPSDDAKYFFVYPFLKTREWYLLKPEERQAMMNDHFKIGHKYPSVKINTSYSFGIDDQEFMVAFESDSPSDFLQLVEELRGVAGSLYTLRDTPIITCIRMSIEDALGTLGG